MKIMEKVEARLITNGTVNGYNLIIVKRVYGTKEMYEVRIRQNENSSVEISNSAVLDVENLADVKLSISIPSKNLEITEIEKHVKEIKDAELAIAEFNEYIRLTNKKEIKI